MYLMKDILDNLEKLVYVAGVPGMLKALDWVEEYCIKKNLIRAVGCLIDYPYIYTSVLGSCNKGWIIWWNMGAAIIPLNIDWDVVVTTWSLIFNIS